MKEVLHIRSQDPVEQDLRRWVQDRGAKKVTKSEQSTVATGTMILDMGEEEAKQLMSELPDVSVLRDQPLELIRPIRGTAAAKKKVTTKDLWHLKAIRLPALRKQGFKGTGKGMVVAVLDTGTDPTHPELAGRIEGCYKLDVGNWSVEKMRKAKDTDGHGTHVAGLICGEKVGVAPGAKVRSAVMLPGGYGNLSDFILALEWAASQPEVAIVNMSAGIPGYLPEMRAAVADILSVGILPVFASGNEGRNQTRSPGNYIEVLSVGASTKNHKVAGFSSGGTLTADHHNYVVPDLVAPGADIYSCVMGGGYEAWDGTSMATPIVSGLAALVLEKYPTISVPDLIDTLLTTCKDLKLLPERQGHGLVQADVVDAI